METSLIDKIKPYIGSLEGLFSEILHDYLRIFGFLLSLSLVSLLSTRIYREINRRQSIEDDSSDATDENISYINKNSLANHIKFLVFLIVIVGFPNGNFFFIPDFIKGISAVFSGILASSIFAKFSSYKV